jgi:ribosomal protein L3
MVHSWLQEAHFSPHFHRAIGAIDGTHIHVVVPSSATIAHFGRYRETTQNVLVVCDFDMRFTFVVAGRPGSVHDIIVFNEALLKYADKFPFPPEGKKFGTTILFVISVTLLIIFVIYV